MRVTLVTLRTPDHEHLKLSIKRSSALLSCTSKTNKPTPIYFHIEIHPCTKIRRSESEFPSSKVMLPGIEGDSCIPNRSQTKPKSTRELLKPYLEKMVSQTYIHGVKEVYESKTLHERLFWIVVCLTCIGAASYEIYQVFRLYKESGVATKISVDNVDTMKYPTVLLCPTTWLSRERMQKLQIEPEVMNFTLSLLEPGGSVPRFQHIPNDTGTLLGRLSEIVSNTRSQSIAGLLKNLSIDAHLHCTCCNRKGIKKHVTLAGVCSVIDLCETAFQLNSIPNILYVVDRRLTADTLAQAPGGFISIFDNRSQIGISNHDTIFLTPNVPVRVKLSVTRIHRIPTDEKPCQNSHNKSPARCEFDCIDRIKNRLCYNCSKYGIFTNNLTFEQCMYAGSSQHQHCEDEDEEYLVHQLLECKRKCIPPCKERVYAVGAVTSMSTIRNDDAFSDDPNFEYLQAEFLFTTFTETVFEDINTFNIDKFISSIGGQTGLWCGASVVSLCQLISFCCCPCLHWTNMRYNVIRRDSNKKSDEEEGSRKGKRKFHERSFSYHGGMDIEERRDSSNHSRLSGLGLLASRRGSQRSYQTYNK